MSTEPSFIRNFNKQALHAYKLGLHHPKSKEYMEFVSDLPQDIKTLIGEFENIPKKGLPDF
ncbi:hypothetical protein [Wolbachia endosymbiont (group A) of Andrena hattorfiana]|uniref:hypothetical protein n=1 Tax=Wolbachia endosymbiont (group A) of Andrena hattorfiana TaxID=2953977 RepID=UPI0021F8C93A|nr:hypothetical protein [Wolbachia endosymbiont (group A) of Andrena hattorfiana]